MRCCGTPGCGLPDNHDGACSPEAASRTRTRSGVVALAVGSADEGGDHGGRAVAGSALGAGRPQEEREALARRECARRREEAAWAGRRRPFHGCVQADELRFSERAPYGVVAPPAAATALGESLRVARGVLQGEELRALQEELAAQPRSLSWGNANDPQMARSKRKFFELDETARESLLRGADRIKSRKALDADLEDAAPRHVCTSELARRVAAHVGLDGDSPLRGMQVNYQHTHYPKVHQTNP